MNFLNIVEDLSKEYNLINDDYIEELMKSITHSYDSKNKNPYHLEDTLYIHTNMVINEAKKLDKDNKILIEAARLHDIGKILSRYEMSERKRVSFRGHEGVSFYLSQAILNAKNTYEKTDIERISTIVALHDIAYKYKDKFMNLNTMQEFVDIFYFTDIKEDYYNLLKLIYADISGRLTTTDIKKENDRILSKIDKFLSEDFELPEINIDSNKPNVYLLIGVQNTGKSTYIERYHKDANILSRDKILMDLCRQYKNNNNISYNECFKFITDMDLQKEVNKRLQQQLHEYKQQDKNIVIDMMNLTKKRRRSFISQLHKKFNIIAIVFYTPFDVIMNRNIERKYAQNKYIAPEIIINSMKNFEYPLLNMENINYKQNN